MDLALFNTSWIALNMYLAILPVFFSLYLFKMPNKLLSAIVGILWFLYLPNTVYVFSDLHHLVEQWFIVELPERLVLILQYALLQTVGLTCFLVAFYPCEIILKKIKLAEKKIIIVLVALNFLMGFAISLGKFERVNSWDVFINPQVVLVSTWNLLTSFELVSLGIIFGLFANFFYFLFRQQAKKIYTRLDNLK